MRADDWFPKTTLGQLPEGAARQWGAREALVFEGKRWTFAALSDEVDRVARPERRLGQSIGRSRLS